VGAPTVAYASENPWVFVVLVNGFIGLSFGMIIFTSAIESIPKDLMNASLVDGSSMIQRIRYVILPLIRWPLLFVVTYQTLSLLTSFVEIQLLTDGGPGLYRTEVWALTAYHRALSNYFGHTEWGYGSAFAIVLVVIGVVLAVVYMRVFRFSELVDEPKIEVL
jgi:inositol-phosphate transport system permease protein